MAFQVVYLGAMLIVVGTDPTAGGDRFILAIVVSLGSLIAGLPVLFAPRSFGWLHPLVFPALYGVIAQVRAFPIYALGLTYHRALPGLQPSNLNDLLTYAVLLSAVASMAYFAGFFLCPTPRAPKIVAQSRRAPVTRLVTIVAVTAGLFVIFLATRGGLASHLAMWSTGRAVSLSGGYYWVLVMRTANVALLVWLALRKDAIRNPLFWASVATAFTMSFLMTGSRSSVLFYIIMGFMVFMVTRRDVPLVRIFALGVTAIFLVGALGSLRNVLGGRTQQSSDMALTETWATAIQEIRTRSGSMRGDVAVYGNVQDADDFLYGSSYISLLTLPVPRGMWPDKPIVIEGRAGREFFKFEGGVPIGGVAEAYWNFHVIGVIAVFYLFGGLMRWISMLYVKSETHFAAIVMYAYTLFNLSPSGTSIVGWILGGVPLVLVLAFVGRYGVLQVRRVGPVTRLRPMHGT